MWDAIVAGAGPAGAVAALMLARSGRRVLLADRIDPPARKIGEALPGAGVRLLRSLDLATVATGGQHAPIGGNLTSWNSAALVATDFLRSPDGPGWRLDRLRFDADLRAAAAGAGATSRAAWVRQVERQEAGWRISFDDGSVEHTRWIVDATGRRAVLARKLGVRRIRDARLVALYAMGRTAADVQLDRTVIEAAPDGWWYAARLPCGTPVAGLHTDPREAARLNADPGAWTDALAGTRHVAAMMRNVRFAPPMRPMDACGARLAQFSGEGWIACGDAATSFDPISGQGLFAALHGGMTAGLAVAGGLDRNRETLADYTRQMETAWSIYRARSRAIYAGERRWPATPFWSRFGRSLDNGAKALAAAG